MEISYMKGNSVLEYKLRQFIESRVGRKFSDLSWEEKYKVYQNLVRGCKACPLCRERKYDPIPSFINKDSKFLFIGRNPNVAEVRDNELFTDSIKQGKLFRKYLSLLDIDQTEISILNLANCMTKHNRYPVQEEFNICSMYKGIELELIGDKYQFVFAMGNDALKWVYGRNSPSILNLFGNLYAINHLDRIIYVVPILHPSHLLLKPQYAKNMAGVLKNVSKFIKDYYNSVEVNNGYKDDRLSCIS